MTQIFMAIASVFGGLSVATGAFAAHALKERLTEKAMAIFETASKYQMYHAIALLIVAILLDRAKTPNIYLQTSGFAFIVGTILFSGSLYALSLSGVKWLGAITPFGGFAFLLGWGCLAIAAFRK
jgi:uncharacterized membrane protein YgdD (TMEM256/DUF423 family)